MYYIHKQLIPTDTNVGDPNWVKRQIWVLKKFFVYLSFESLFFFSSNYEIR